MSKYCNTSIRFVTVDQFPSLEKKVCEATTHVSNQFPIKRRQGVRVSKSKLKIYLVLSNIKIQCSYL